MKGHSIERDDLMVAKRVGSPVYLTKSQTTRAGVFAPLSESTMFFREDTAEADLRRMHVDPVDVVMLHSRVQVSVG